MPTAIELARQEAERADRERDDDEQEDVEQEDVELERGDEQQPHPGDGLEEPSEEMMVELRAACADHHDHVHAIMGPFVEGFTVCEDCNGIGIAYPRPATRQLKLAPNTTVCEVCAGQGELSTGSKRQGYDVIQCTNCNGHGWIGQGNLPAIAAAAAAAAAVGAEQPQQTPPPFAGAPAVTDPRVLQLQAEGFIVLPKPTQ